jgi:hypothetical protein
MILTAARPDRTSFGCSEDDKYPYFDDCFLSSAPAAHDFAALGRAVQACVPARARNGDPSRPRSRSCGSAPAFARCCPCTPSLVRRRMRTASRDLQAAISERASTGKTARPGHRPFDPRPEHPRSLLTLIFRAGEVLFVTLRLSFRAVLLAAIIGCGLFGATVAETQDATSSAPPAAARSASLPSAPMPYEATVRRRAPRARSTAPAAAPTTTAPVAATLAARRAPRRARPHRLPRRSSAAKRRCR